LSYSYQGNIMNYKTTVLSVTILLSACASTVAPKIKYDNVSIPKLNEPSVAYLGDNLLLNATGYYVTSIEISEVDAFAADIQGGTFYNVPGTIKYASKVDNTVTINNGYGQPLSNQNWVKYYPATNEICPSLGLCYDDPEVEINFIKELSLVINNSAFQQVIEYNGKSGNILKFTYREFTGHMVRQPYTTNFTMDLNDGNSIGYKGALIKVEEANNNLIKYSVTRNFNKKI
jgi:hypothetical protein